MDENGHVRINGQVFLYRAKAPFVRSGESVLGALEYKPDDDKLKCHECGKWFENVGSHAALKHKISGPQYKRKHGLGSKTALVSERQRLIYSRQGREMAPRLTASNTPEKRAATRERLERSPLQQKHTPEHRNLTDTCQAQLLTRLRSIAEALGRTPTRRELKASGISPSSLCTTFNMSPTDLSGVMSLLGFLPNARYHAKYDRPLLVELLRDFYTHHGRLPYHSDFRRKLLPAWSRYKYHFGSFENACNEAGLGQIYRQQTS